ncbi:MAG: glycosyltransferase [Candidatus Marinimicrobia bacterium]|nr:glycosyltransferase [Candidatus Neomarinimicrobiota bacterium]
MIKADLHVHSKYSEHPSEWFLQRLGAAESYTEPEYIYQTAKQKGMDLVTITDHNRIDGALYLKNKYPDDVFLGVEATSYFPEDGCKIHLLIYGFTPEQFEKIQTLRVNIYDLRDFIRENQLPYSVAHATYSVNGRLSLDHLEKLILLFDVFESINGGRNRINNNVWTEVLGHLTPVKLVQLMEKWNITPFSDNPWIKGFTGGSDDHAGLFIGDTFTIVDAADMPEFLNKIRSRKTVADGRYNNYQSMAFIVYKIAAEYIKSKGRDTGNSVFTKINDLVFENSKKVKIKGNLKYKAYRILSKDSDNTQYLLMDLIDGFNKAGSLNIEKKFILLYQKISNLSDHLFIKFLESIKDNFNKSDIYGIFQNLMSFLPSIFISLPFFSSLKVMYGTRHLVQTLSREYLGKKGLTRKRILWFTDTINDLNGVSVIIKKVASVGRKNGMNIHVVTSLKESEINEHIPPNLLNLPYIYNFNLPYYESYNLKIPSILQSLEMIDHYEPDEIVISTPGPIGLIGLLASRLWNIKSIGIYHTDFSYQVKEIINDESITSIIDTAVKWFYSAVDEVRVPTNEYISILTERGIDPKKMRLFQRGIDTELFAPNELSRIMISSRYSIKEGVNLLYTGRISKDKNLDFLLDVYRDILIKHDNTNLVIAGDGPYIQTLRNNTADLDRCYILGQLPREDLVDLYAGSDLFIFPSVTDTFGMVVLEAQSCGLPAVVSNEGGPKEIIIDGQTGFVVDVNNKEEWTKKCSMLIHLCQYQREQYFDMCDKARENVLAFCSWNTVLNDLFDEEMNMNSHTESVNKLVLA